MCIRLILVAIVSLMMSTNLGHAEKFQIPKEMDEFLTLKEIPDELFEDNLYVGWMGFGYPDDDWQTIYKGFFKKNDDIFNHLMAQGDTVAHHVADYMKKSLVSVLDSSVIPFSDVFDEYEILLLSYQVVKSKEFHVFIQAPLNNERYVGADSYFTCAKYRNINCIQQIRDRKDYIQSTILDNQELLNRFRKLTAESKFNYALYFNDLRASGVMMPQASMSRIYQLNLAESIMQLLNGDISEGLNNLVLARRWLDLTYNQDSRPTVFQFIMNILYTQYLDQAIDAILDAGLLSDYLDDPRVMYIVRLYSDDVGTALNTALLWEISQKFKSRAYPYVKVYVQNSRDLQLSDEEELIALNFFKTKGMLLPIGLFTRYQNLIGSVESIRGEKLNELEKIIGKILGENFDRPWMNTPTFLEGSGIFERHEQWYANFFFSLNATPKSVLRYLNIKFPSTEYYVDYFKLINIIDAHKEEHLTERRLDELLRSQLSPKHFERAKRFTPYDSFDVYWIRLYEQQNYHKLIYLKYLVMKNQMNVKEIQTFLASVGNLANNTISHQPYHFDSNNMTLSTPLPKNRKYIPVNIREAYIDNPEINDFIVRLPKY